MKKLRKIQDLLRISLTSIFRLLVQVEVADRSAYGISSEHLKDTVSYRTLLSTPGTVQPFLGCFLMGHIRDEEELLRNQMLIF